MFFVVHNIIYSVQSNTSSVHVFFCENITVRTDVENKSDTSPGGRYYVVFERNQSQEKMRKRTENM